MAPSWSHKPLEVPSLKKAQIHATVTRKKSTQMIRKLIKFCILHSHLSLVGLYSKYFDINKSIVPGKLKCTSIGLTLKFENQRRLNKSEAVNYCQHYFPNSTFPYRLDQLIELGFESLKPPHLRSWGNLGPSPWFGVSYDPIKKIMIDDLTGLILFISRS